MFCYSRFPTFYPSDVFCQSLASTCFYCWLEFVSVSAFVFVISLSRGFQRKSPKGALKLVCGVAPVVGFKRKWIQMRKVNGETKGHSQKSPFCGCEKTMQYALMRCPRLNSAEPWGVRKTDLSRSFDGIFQSQCFLILLRFLLKIKHCLPILASVWWIGYCTICTISITFLVYWQWQNCYCRLFWQKIICNLRDWTYGLSVYP